MSKMSSEKSLVSIENQIIIPSIFGGENKKYIRSGRNSTIAIRNQAPLLLQNKDLPALKKKKSVEQSTLKMELQKNRK